MILFLRGFFNVRCEWLGLSFKVMGLGFGDCILEGILAPPFFFFLFFPSLPFYVVRVSFLFVRSIDKILSIA